MMENLGFLAAIGSALAWGTYIVPFKIAKSKKLIFFQAIMSLGILLSGIVISLIFGYSLRLNGYGLLAGILWGVANAVSLIAIVNLGLSRAAPLMTSLVIISSFLWGAIVFGEISSGLMKGFAGIGLIILGVIVVSAIGNTRSQNIKKGLMAGIFSGTVWGSQLVPLKIGNVATGDFFLSVCLGIFVTGLLILVISKVRFEKEALKEGLLSGVIWNIGNLLSLISLSIIGLSKMGPLSQSAVLVAVLWGLFYFREITKPKDRLQVLIGAVILVAGLVTLGFA